MGNIIERVGELSTMNKDLSAQTLEEFRGQVDKFADRLKKVQEVPIWQRPALRGTHITNPRVLAYNNRGRLEELVLRDPNGMSVSHLLTAEGNLVLMPLHVIGATSDGRPVVDPGVKGSFSIAHALFISGNDFLDAARMRTDLIFTADADNLVTVNGQNPVTAEEYALFDQIVQEFEHRGQVTVTE